MFKLNAKSEVNKVLNNQILESLSESGYTVDRFGHAIKVKSNGKKYRLKFQATSIRYEIQVEYEASLYSPATKGWILIKTVRYSELHNQFLNATKRVKS